MIDKDCSDVIIVLTPNSNFWQIFPKNYIVYSVSG
jgi:hypothetical protein